MSPKHTLTNLHYSNLLLTCSSFKVSVCLWQNLHSGVNDLRMPLGLTGGQWEQNQKLKS